MRVETRFSGENMTKETKSDYFHLRMAPSMKEKLFKRAAELGKEPSVYITELMEKDIAGYDLTDSEKPRMKEFSRMVGREIADHITGHIDKAYMKSKSREERILALLYYQYRISLYQFYNLAMRVKASGQMSPSDLKSCEDESKKIVNSSFEKYLDLVLTKDADSLVEYLKNPL